jgi:hypothetical protein
MAGTLMAKRYISNYLLVMYLFDSGYMGRSGQQVGHQERSQPLRRRLR